MTGSLTSEDMDNYESIRSYSGFYTGQFPDDSIMRLSDAGLIETYWEGPGAFMGLSRVRATS